MNKDQMIFWMIFGTFMLVMCTLVIITATERNDALSRCQTAGYDALLYDNNMEAYACYNFTREVRIARGTG